MFYPGGESKKNIFLKINFRGAVTFSAYFFLLTTSMLIILKLKLRVTGIFI